MKPQKATAKLRENSPVPICFMTVGDFCKVYKLVNSSPQNWTVTVGRKFTDQKTAQQFLESQGYKVEF